MKLEFNPKVVGGGDVGAIYILDEPGSYLHAVAQERLCLKLRQLSQENKVIYCTHSHHLLNPDVISLSSIRIAEKDGSGEVKLVPINEHKGSILERRSAYQPVLDALQIRPFKIDLANDAIVIVEGMIDYYLIDMFRRGQVLKILPSVGAESIMFYISIMIAWRIPYRALWDNDSAGRRSREIAAKHFGDREAIKFRLLPVGEKKTAKRIMQDLVAGEDLVQIRTLLGIPSDTDFAKTITTLYYSSERTKILDVVSNRTWSGFDNLFASLEIEGQSP